MRITSPTNVKKYLLEYASSKRAHKFTRVSQQTLDAIEVAAKIACQRVVDTAPSKGVTL
jgi:hypothetical protein